MLAKVPAVHSQHPLAAATATFDAVVLALPFTILRNVDLDASLGLPDSKKQAIEQLGYGTNAKMMVGFNGRPWINQGGNGEAYSNLTNHQLTWETNPLMASASRGVLTDYSSGQRGAGLDPGDPQAEANRFLQDLDNIFPGALAAVSALFAALNELLDISWIQKEADDRGISASDEEVARQFESKGSAAFAPVVGLSGGAAACVAATGSPTCAGGANTGAEGRAATAAGREALVVSSQ